MVAFGFEEAALRGRPQRAVRGYREAVEGDTSAGAEEGRIVAGRLGRTTSPWREKYPYVDADTSLVPLPPREALLDAAEGAGLLVVGGHGLGGAMEFRLGTVTNAMLQHAPCPVAVVRPSATGPE